jgi:flagellar biosynthesis GTPase FlhF
MLLKRYEAKTLPEALARVRAECGDDALVVETRTTRAGYLVVAARPGARTDTLPPRDQAGSATVLSKWTRGFQPLADTATDFGLSPAVLRAVEKALLGTRVDLSRPGDPALASLASRVLAALVRTEPRLEEPAADGAFRTVALVGPTGVGKTTTLAKLAARACARGERVAVVTLDTYRMAAVEQLRAFADLLGVPFEVAFTPHDLERTLRTHAHCDRVFVDTTGRSPRDRNALPLLEGTLRAGDCATLLCLAAGTRARDCHVVLDAFAPLAIDAVCLTKWDETTVPGEALAVVVERGLPVSHLCIGQEVPADILPARATELAAAAFACEPAQGVA